MSRPIAMITGASSGIGAVYADRLAGRGYDLILVARDLERLRASANALSQKHAVAATPFSADLGKPEDLERVADRLREDNDVSFLVNSAGVAPSGTVLGSLDADLDRTVFLSVNVLHTLTVAAAKAFSARGGGGIVNLASVVALMPEKFNGSYSAAKSFVFTLTQSLASELDTKDVRIQAVMPGFTRTEIFERAGVDSSGIPSGMMMDAGQMVDAALAGFDMGEVVTIPSLNDDGLWVTFERARHELAPYLSLDKPGSRYTPQTAQE